VINVTADHLGLKDIESIADMARVKGVVRACRRRGWLRLS
jgi:hypothetical protein